MTTDTAMVTAFGVVIVGDEILSARRNDKHLAFISQLLAERGLPLRWARYIGDDPEAQASLYRETLASGCSVFSFGGIGATPDDHSRQAAAQAAGVALVQHAEATALIEERFGEAAYPHRVRMAQLPDGCTLIPNPVNQIAGFSVGNHHFLPGFPDMAWPMARWVLDQYYAGLGVKQARFGLLVPNAKEGDLITLMETLVTNYPDLGFSCLPSYGNARHAGPHIEFSLSGEAGSAEQACNWLKAALLQQGYQPQAV